MELVQCLFIYRSTDNPMCDPGILCKMFVPLSLKDEESDKILWHDQSPNSTFYTRPLLLITEKENHELVTSFRK